MATPYVWAPVQPAQVADDVAINALGAAVTAHDASITALTGLAPAYRARQTVTGTPASVLFGSIPTTLNKITVEYVARGDAAVLSQALLCRVNSDATANYYGEVLTASAAVVSSAGTIAATSITCGLTTGSSSAAGVFATGEFTWRGWDPTRTSPVVSFEAMAPNSVHTTGGGMYFTAAGVGPYTALLLLPAAGNFVAGSDFWLTGWV